MLITVKGASLKGYSLYGSNHRTFWKRQNCGHKKRSRGCRGWGRSSGEHRGFWGSDTTLMTVMVDLCHCTFVQTHRPSNPKTEACCPLRTLANNNISTLVHLL